MKRFILLFIAALAAPVLLPAQPAYPPAPSPAASISAIEWFIDNDPGFGNGAAVPFAMAADIPSLVVPVSLVGVKPGIHRLFVRSRDNAGNWALTASANFENFHPTYAPPATAATPITELEVFFDNDPGFGNGFKQAVPAGTDVSGFNFPVGTDTLSQGAHQLFVRSFSDSWSFSEVRTFSNDHPLPLTWLYVRGELTGDQTLIGWGTARENNTQRFDIERSADGGLFNSIGSVAAAGNSSSPLDYHWLDASPALGINYYRIRQSDLDGKFTYSAVVTVLYRNGLTQTIVAPNPATDQVTLLFARSSEPSSLNVYNAAGRMVLSGKIEKGEQQHVVDIRSLPAGMYMLQLVHDKMVETLRVFKK
ncbi:MAG TPA: T9SS type A sorting domain-containing protein [Puia sp.]|nr:T9SS type A sorting domain-containing protein [Puia sp.]